MLKSISKLSEINRKRLEEREKKREKKRLQKKKKEKLRRMKLIRQDPALHVFRRTKARAKQARLRFNLDLHDIHIPHLCPVLGIPISVNAKHRDNAVSIDRVDSRFGYVKGNVVIVSFRANRLKSNAHVDELRHIASFYEKLYRDSAYLREERRHW